MWPGTSSSLPEEFGITWLGRITREHGDVDVLVFQDDQSAVRKLSATGFQAGSFDDQRAKRGIICGTPKTVLAELRIALEKLRPGIAVLWDGDGAMTHDDAMRSLRLVGEEILPAMREWAKELDLPGPFEVDPATGKRLEGAAVAASA